MSSLPFISPGDSETTGISSSLPPCPHKERPSLFGPGSTLSTCSLLISSAIGTGVLALPFAMKSGGGPLVGIIAFCVSAVSAVLANYVLALAATKTGLATYGALIDWALDQFRHSGTQESYHSLEGDESPRGVKVAGFDLFMMVYQAAVVVTYHVFLGDFLPELLGIQTATARLVSILCVAYLVVLPLSLAREIAFLRYLSSFSLWAILLASVMAVWKAPGYMSDHMEAVGQSMAWSNVQVSLHTLNTLSVCFFSFFNQINAVPIAHEMYLPTPHRLLLVCMVYGVFLTVIFLTIACAVYWSFMENTQANFLMNYQAHDLSVQLCRVFLSCMLLVACPMNLFPCLSGLYRVAEVGAQGSPAYKWTQLCARLHESSQRSVTTRLVVSWVVLTLIVTVAVSVSNIADFIGTLSSYMTVPIMTLFPAALFVLVMPRPSANDSRLKWVAFYAPPTLMVALTVILWIAATLRILFQE